MRKILLSVFLLASFSLIANAWLEVGNPRDPRDPLNSPSIICNRDFSKPRNNGTNWELDVYCFFYNDVGKLTGQGKGKVVCPVRSPEPPPSLGECIQNRSVGRTWRCYGGSCSSGAPANR